MTDDTPAPEEQLTPEKAFARSDAHTFNGIKLFPLTPQRSAAAYACGMAFGTQEMKRGADGTYPKLAYDAILVLYLCTVEGAPVRAAFTSPDVVIEAAMSWADKNGVDPLTAKGGDAVGVFSAIMEDVMISSGVPEPREGEPQKTGPPDPNAPSRRRGRK